MRSIRGWPTQAEGGVDRIKQYHPCGDQKYSAEAIVSGNRRANQGAGNVANIAERLVIAKDTTGNLVAGVIHQQRLHCGQQRTVGGAEQEAQDTELQRVLHK